MRGLQSAMSKIEDDINSSCGSYDDCQLAIVTLLKVLAALRLAIEQRDSLIEAVFDEHQIDDWERRRNSEILAILSESEGA